MRQLLLLISLGTFFVAEAGSSNPSKPLETYSATEEGSEPVNGSFISQTIPTTVKLSSGRLARPSSSNKFEKKVTKRASKESKTSEIGYDLVPTNQTDPLIQRLKLVEQLILKYNRAYDYRVHTIKDLESILAKLDQKNEQSGPQMEVTAPSDASSTGQDQENPPAIPLESLPPPAL